VQKASLGWVFQAAGINHELGAPLRRGAKAVSHFKKPPQENSPECSLVIGRRIEAGRIICVPNRFIKRRGKTMDSTFRLTNAQPRL
jgi:hypothetical protein